jgi:hypothetical protein
MTTLFYKPEGLFMPLEGNTPSLHERVPGAKVLHFDPYVKETVMVIADWSFLRREYRKAEVDLFLTTVWGAVDTRCSWSADGQGLNVELKTDGLNIWTFPHIFDVVGKCWCFPLSREAASEHDTMCHDAVLSGVRIRLEE